MIDTFKLILNKLITRKYFPLFITTLMILISSLSILGLMSQSTLVIEKESVIMRSGPGTNQSAVTTLSQGDEIHVINEENGWLYVRATDQSEGWVPEWYLENENLTDDRAIGGHVVFSTEIYSEPNTNSTELGTIEAGTYIIINYESQGWIQFEYDNQIGFIPTETVDIIPIEEVPEIEPEEAVEQPEDIEEQIAANENVVVVRQANQPLLDSPSMNANFIYDTELNQEFMYLESAYDDFQNEFYLVEDSNGLRGYLESRVVAFVNDSVGHVGQPSVDSLSEAVIMIDAGHGGEDPGAVSADDQTYEKDATLSTAHYLQVALEEMGATVLMTRTNDESVDLDQRTNMSNEQEVDTFISLHYDAALNNTWNGTTSYYFHPDDYDLVQSINNSLLEAPLPNNGVLFGNYHVLRENNQPSVLLELGYMSSNEDLPYIRSQEYHQEVANAIANGLNNYYNSLSE